MPYPDQIEGPRFQTRGSLYSVTVHRIADPCHNQARLPNRTDKVLPDVFGAHSHDDGETARLVIGVEQLTGFD